MADFEYYSDATTDDFVLFCNDIRQRPTWRSLYADGLLLSALHIRPGSDHRASEIVLVLRKLVLEVLAEQQLRRLLLFIANGPWQDNNRIVNYRRIWKSGRLQSLKWPETHRGPEVRITSDKGVRYASLGLVDETTIDTAIDLLFDGSFSTFMLVSNLDFASVDATQALFNATFPINKHGIPIDGRENWGVLIHQQVTNGDLVIKQSGLFRGLEWCLDIIGTPEVLDPLTERLCVFGESIGPDLE